MRILSVVFPSSGIRLIFLRDAVLNRNQKERILLPVSATNQNTYFVAVHAEILTLSGVAVEDFC